ncbi:hypothetical protein BGZ73_002654 [Actinomortierella ambigua]|nr:hypothetical protein BGZ73_002654 [Actinomortierella ambigua]
MGTLIKIVTHVDGRRLERVFEFDPLSTCRSAVEKVCDALTIPCEWTFAMFSRKHQGWIHDKTKMEDIVFKGHKILEMRHKTPAFFEAPLITPLKPSKSFLRDSTSILKGSASPLDHHRLFNLIFRSGEGEQWLSKFKKGAICLSIVLFNHENKILLSPNGLLPTLQMATIEEADSYNFDSDSSDFAWMVKTALGWNVEAEVATSSSLTSSPLGIAAPRKKRSSSLRRALSRSPSRSRSRSLHDSQIQEEDAETPFADTNSTHSTKDPPPPPPPPVEIYSSASLQSIHSPPLASLAWSPRSKGNSNSKSKSGSTAQTNSKHTGSNTSQSSQEKAKVIHQSPQSTVLPPAPASPRFSRSIHDQHISLAAALSADSSVGSPDSAPPTPFPDRSKDYTHENALRQGFVATMQQAQDKLGLVEPLTMVYDKVYELPQVGIKTVVAMQHIPEMDKDRVATALIQLGNFRWRHADSFSHSVYSGKEEFWTDVSNTYENHKAPALSSGLYVGLFHTESHLSGLRILVPRHRRNMIPLAKIRDDAELSDTEWEWIQSTSAERDADMLAKRCSVPKDDPMHHLKVEFARAANKLAKQTKVQWKPCDLYTEDTLRLYTAQASLTPSLLPAAQQYQQQEKNGPGALSDALPVNNANGGRKSRGDADSVLTASSVDCAHEVLTAAAPPLPPSTATGRSTGAVKRQNRFIALNSDALWRDPMFQMSESQLRSTRSTEVRIILYVKPTRLATDRRAVYNDQYLEYHPYQIFDATHHLVYNPVVYHSLRKAMRQLTEHALAVEARLANSLLVQQEEELVATKAASNTTTTTSTTPKTMPTSASTADAASSYQKPFLHHPSGTLSESTLADLDVKGDFVSQPRRPSMITMAPKRMFNRRMSVFSLEQEDEEEEEEESVAHGDDRRNSIITSPTNTVASSTISSHHQFSGVSDHGDDEFEAQSPRSWLETVTPFHPSYPSSSSSSSPSPWKSRRPAGALILDAVKPLRQSFTTSSNSSSSSTTSSCSSPPGKLQYPLRTQHKALPQLPAQPSSRVPSTIHQGLFAVGPQSSYLFLKPASPLLPPEHPFGEGYTQGAGATSAAAAAGSASVGGAGGGKGDNAKSNNNGDTSENGSSIGDLATIRRSASVGTNDGHSSASTGSSSSNQSGRRRSSVQDHTRSRLRRGQEPNILDFLRTVEQQCQKMADSLKASDLLSSPSSADPVPCPPLQAPLEPAHPLSQSEPEPEPQQQQQQQGDDNGFEKLMLQYAALISPGEIGGYGSSGSSGVHARTRSGTVMERPRQRTSSFHSTMTNYSATTLNSPSADWSYHQMPPLVSSPPVAPSSLVQGGGGGERGGGGLDGGHDRNGSNSTNEGEPRRSMSSMLTLLSRHQPEDHRQQSLTQPSSLHPALESLEQQKQQLVERWRHVSWTRRINTYALQQVPDLLTPQQKHQADSSHAHPKQQQQQQHQQQQQQQQQHSAQPPASPQITMVPNLSIHSQVHSRNPSSSVNSLISTATTLSQVSQQSGCANGHGGTARSSSLRSLHSKASSSKLSSRTSPSLPPFSTISSPVPIPVSPVGTREGTTPSSPSFVMSTPKGGKDGRVRGSGEDGEDGERNHEENNNESRTTSSSSSSSPSKSAAPTLELGKSLMSPSSLALSIQQQLKQQEPLPAIPPSSSSSSSLLHLQQPNEGTTPTMTTITTTTTTPTTTITTTTTMNNTLMNPSGTTGTSIPSPPLPIQVVIRPTYHQEPHVGHPHDHCPPHDDLQSHHPHNHHVSDPQHPQQEQRRSSLSSENLKSRSAVASLLRPGNMSTILSTANTAATTSNSNKTCGRKSSESSIATSSSSTSASTSTSTNTSTNTSATITTATSLGRRQSTKKRHSLHLQSPAAMAALSFFGFSTSSSSSSSLSSSSSTAASNAGGGGGGGNKGSSSLLTESSSSSSSLSIFSSASAASSSSSLVPGAATGATGRAGGATGKPYTPASPMPSPILSFKTARSSTSTMSATSTRFSQC